MITVAAIRAMLANGLTLDQVLLALEGIEAAARSNRTSMTNAERQAKHRAKKKAEATTRDIGIGMERNENNESDVTPVTSVTSVTNSTDPRVRAVFAGEEVNNIPPEKATLSTPKGAPKRDARGTRLAEDWEPTEADRQFARERLPSSSACREELAKFREHFLAKPGADARKLDWSLTWRKWVRIAAERLPRGPPGSGNLDRKPTLIDAVRARREKRNQSPDDDVPAEEGGGLRGNPVRLLSAVGHR